MARTARVLQFSPKVGREFASCPRWCVGHTDSRAGRRHAGPVAAIPGISPATGAPVTLSLWVGLIDDGFGNPREVFTLDLAGHAVELTPGGMHQLLQRDGDRVFWELDASDAPIGFPVTVTSDTPAHAAIKPCPNQNRGGRA